MIDLTSATSQLGKLLEGVQDAQLTARTPCPDYSLGQLIDHINGLSLAFTAAAAKDLGPMTAQNPAESAYDAANLGDDWRTRIPAQLAALAEAWREPGASQGMTQAGGIDLPGEIAIAVALNEVVIHGWDVARATGQPYEADATTVAACVGFVSEFPADGTPGLFGPAVEPSADASALDRLIARTGRNPAWTP